MSETEIDEETAARNRRVEEARARIRARRAARGESADGDIGWNMTLKDLTLGMHSITFSFVLAVIDSQLPEEYDRSLIGEFLSASSRFMEGKGESGRLFSLAKSLENAIKDYPIDEELRQTALDSLADYEKFKEW